MKYQFFTVPVAAPEKAQEKLNHFCSQYRVVDIEKKLIKQAGNHVWAFCISYIESTALSEISNKKQANRKRIDYKEVLSEDDFNKYAELRNLRKQIAEQQGVPVYAVFTNEQLATMVQQRVLSLSQLKAVEGIGESRLEKYGEAFIACLGTIFNETPAS